MQPEDIIKRNNQIYKKYLKGIKRAELAKEHNLSTTRISQICDKLNYVNRKIASLSTPNAKNLSSNIP